MPNFIDPNELFFTAFQPKIARSFILRIEGIPTFMVKKIDRPKFDQAEIEIPHINVTQKIKGKTKWQNLSCELYDPIEPSGMQTLMEWQRLHHETATGRDGYQDFYKKNITLLGLGPTGDYVEEWTIHGAFIASLETGTFDWGDDSGLMMINVTFAYDYAVLQY